MNTHSGSAEILTHLRYDCQLGTQLMQAQGGRDHLVYQDAATCRFNQAEQAERHGRLSRPRPAHDAHLAAGKCISNQ